MLLLDRQKNADNWAPAKKIMVGRVENNHSNIKPFSNLNSKNCVIMDQNCSENPLFGMEGIPDYALVLDGVSPSVQFQLGSKYMIFFDKAVDLAGFIGLSRYPEEEMDQQWVHLEDTDGFDLKGLKMKLGLQPTQNQVTLAIINGVGFVSGWINPLDTQQMPTLLKQLENRISRLTSGMSSFGPNKFPGPGPVSFLPPRDPFADSNFSIGGLNVKVNDLAIPKTLKIKPVDLPCLLCYSNRNWVGNYELYIPAINRAFSPPLSINLSRYLMVVQNHSSCEFLLFDVNAYEVVIHRGLDDEVITFPTLTLYAKYGELIGWFERVAGEYYVLMVSLQALAIDERTCVSFYWKHPSQAEWDSLRHHGDDYLNGWVDLLDTQPAMDCLMQLEVTFTGLMGGSRQSNKFPRSDPGPVTLPGRHLDPFADTILDMGCGSLLKVKSLSIPDNNITRFLDTDPSFIPCLLCYSYRGWVGDFELYFPSIDRKFTPQLAFNFSRYILVAQNHERCESCLFDPTERDVVIYNGLEDQVITFPRVRRYSRRDDLIGILGCFDRVEQGGHSDYYIFFISFHLVVENDSTRVSFYWRRPFQGWNVAHFNNFTPFEQLPMAPMMRMVGEVEVFAWVDTVSGAVFSVTDWRMGFPHVGVPHTSPELQHVNAVFSVNDRDRLCLVVSRDDQYLVFDVTFHFQDDGVLMLFYTPKLNLNSRNFYCSGSAYGFSAEPLVSIADLTNAIYIGGWLGNCCRVNNFIEMAQGVAASMHVRANVHVLRVCHNPVVVLEPLQCECESAFFLAPVQMLEGIFPDFASLVFRSA